MSKLKLYNKYIGDIYVVTHIIVITANEFGAMMKLKMNYKTKDKFMKHTGLDTIKDIAIQLIHTKPEPIEASGFCKYLYMSHSVIIFPNTNESFNIF